ncbi:HNH endonuclease [Cupriavidus sp. TMH.W2]|uniref:HNH endonuclease n=1 Tax=Cupriavidus sp. TMH.W2 TaxID=3434465 RepID=UPI003D772F0A
MAKGRARLPESYANEELALALVPVLLTAHGFTGVTLRKRGQVKLVDARNAAGEALCFWLKQGWTGDQKFCAVQFGLFGGEADRDIPDARFLTFVDDRVAGVKALGATHALFIHMAGGLIRNWVALRADDVSTAYHRQMAGWPVRARNTKSPTLWFEEDREVDGAECIRAVLDVEISLATLASGLASEAGQGLPEAGAGPAVRKVTVEVERRMKQAAFRLQLGHHYGWRCAVSGNTLRETLEAAHLPGRNWRVDNRVTDGILLRADLHRLLDAGLARIVDHRFVIEARARTGDYAQWHDVPLPLIPENMA